MPNLSPEKIYSPAESLPNKNGQDTPEHSAEAQMHDSETEKQLILDEAILKMMGQTPMDARTREDYLENPSPGKQKEIYTKLGHTMSNKKLYKNLLEFLPQIINNKNAHNTSLRLLEQIPADMRTYIPAQHQDKFTDLELIKALEDYLKENNSE